MPPPCFRLCGGNGCGWDGCGCCADGRQRQWRSVGAVAEAVAVLHGTRPTTQSYETPPHSLCGPPNGKTIAWGVQMVQSFFTDVVTTSPFQQLGPNNGARENQRSCSCHCWARNRSVAQCVLGDATVRMALVGQEEGMYELHVEKMVFERDIRRAG